MSHSIGILFCKNFYYLKRRQLGCLLLSSQKNWPGGSRSEWGRGYLCPACEGHLLTSACWILWILDNVCNAGVEHKETRKSFSTFRIFRTRSLKTPHMPKLWSQFRIWKNDVLLSRVRLWIFKEGILISSSCSHSGLFSYYEGELE